MDLFRARMIIFGRQEASAPHQNELEHIYSVAARCRARLHVQAKDTKLVPAFSSTAFNKAPATANSEASEMQI